MNISFSCAGFLFLITGHSILRRTDLAGYDFPLQSSMQVGAVGGAIFTPALLVLGAIIHKIIPSDAQDSDEEREDGWTPPEKTGFHRFLETCLTLTGSSGLGAAAGAIGSAVLRIHGKTTMDSLHAARAGALGGAVLGPGILVALMALGIIIQILPCEIGCWKQRTIQSWG